MSVFLASSKILEAVSFAINAHRLQKRTATNMPYIQHPVEVALLLTNEGIDETRVLVAAILHDVVEDTSVTFAQITAQFGQHVADLVVEVTDDRSLSKANHKRAQIAHAAHMSYGACVIKMADKLHNLTDRSKHPIPRETLEQTQGYAIWCKAVIDAMPLALVNSDDGIGLKRQLADLFANGTVWIDGKEHPMIPKDVDEKEALERYLVSCDRPPIGQN